MQSKPTKMTFRFQERGGNDHKINSESQIEEHIPKSDVLWSEWNTLDPKQVEESEAERVERWIRETEMNDSAVNSLHEEEPPQDMRDLETDHQRGQWAWENGSAHEVQDYEVIGPAHTRKRSPSIIKVAGSVMGAIATGLLFGFLALSLLRGEVDLPSVNQTVPAIVQKQEKPNAQAGTQPLTEDGSSVTGGSNAAGTINPDNKAASKVNIPASTAYVLQYGVFSMPEGAEKAIAELRELGLGAVLSNADGNQRVYTAIALQRDDAMLLGEALQAKQITLYVRSMDRPSMTELAFEGEPETLNSFIKQSDVVREWLIQNSSRMLRQSKQEAFEVKLMDELRTEHLRWTQWGQKLQQNMTKDKSAQWLKLVQSMNTAITAVNEYNKKPAASHLWNIQQACMQYMLLEQEWLNDMKI